MYKLSINKLSTHRVMQLLGIQSIYEYDPEKFPRPTKLRRSYKTVCKVCNMLSTSYFRGERISICWNCKILISREALRIKINRDRQKRFLALKCILLWIFNSRNHTYSNYSYLSNKILEYM